VSDRAAARRRAAPLQVRHRPPMPRQPPGATWRAGRRARAAAHRRERPQHRAPMRRVSAAAPRGAARAVRGVETRVVGGALGPRDAGLSRRWPPAASPWVAQAWRRVGTAACVWRPRSGGLPGTPPARGAGAAGRGRSPRRSSHAPAPGRARRAGAACASPGAAGPGARVARGHRARARPSRDGPGAAGERGRACARGDGCRPAGAAHRRRAWRGPRGRAAVARRRAAGGPLRRCGAPAGCSPVARAHRAGSSRRGGGSVRSRTGGRPARSGSHGGRTAGPAGGPGPTVGGLPRCSRLGTGERAPPGGPRPGPPAPASVPTPPCAAGPRSCACAARSGLSLRGGGGWVAQAVEVDWTRDRMRGLHSGVGSAQLRAALSSTNG
jgi:hypothetical protein